MARRKKNDKKNRDDLELDSLGRISNKNKRGLRSETKYSIYGIFCVILALFFTLSHFDKASTLGEYTKTGVDILFGIHVGYIILSVASLMLAVSFFKSIKHSLSLLHVFGSLLFLTSSLGLIHTFFLNNEGGWLGKVIADPLLSLVGIYTTPAILIAFVITSILIIFDTHLSIRPFLFWKKEESDEEPDINDSLNKELDKKSLEADKKFIEEAKAETKKNKFGLNLFSSNKDQKNGNTNKDSNDTAGNDIDTDGEPRIVNNQSRNLEVKMEKIIPVEQRKLTIRTYNPPPISLLEKDKGKPDVGDIKGNQNIIKRNLEEFNIAVEMDEVTVGPTFTRYALKPAQGVRLSKIVALQNDLTMALAAHSIRIEAPIPGKSLVGIEVPNTIRSSVGLASLLSDPEYVNSDKPLLVSLGKGISGKAHFMNLAKAPHLLIAGTTGSGKSVAIHTIIASLLYKNSPDQLKMIMIDPKRVELTNYNNIPHLYVPVITDYKKTIQALRYMGNEMERRYDILEKYRKQNIDEYHRDIVAPAIQDIKENGHPADEEAPETMPYVVIVIDELADIMQQYPRELEAAIVRLAQKSRAVGIHLILSTQRPSVNVITGLIKANIPSRVALKVASQMDSRIILDTPGAEDLLGAGDMLYMTSEMAKPMRVQSPFISGAELKKVVSYLINEYKDEPPQYINIDMQSSEKNPIFSSSMDGDDDGDELYSEAKKIVLENKKASTSFLQRKLSVGYARAARLIDLLEQNGIIGPGDGAKPREILAKGDDVPQAVTSNEPPTN